MYYDNWSCKEDVARDFHTSEWPYEPNPEVLAADILFAAYNYEDYSGYAMVIFEQNGKLYEVHGSHCSCYGLEGQWDPEPTDRETLLGRLNRTDYGIMDRYRSEIRQALA
mgnify:CR=1 FL=1